MTAEALCLDAVMFDAATSFNQDIDNWNTGRVMYWSGESPLLCLLSAHIPLCLYPHARCKHALSLAPTLL